MKTKNLAKISICIAIICVSAYISFPLPFTPVMVTAQTITINLVALILKPKDSFIAVLVYVLLGAFGLPVFSGGIGGFGKIFGPTGGFILGFLVIAPLISCLKGTNNNIKRYIFVTIFVGQPILYVSGSIFMSIMQKITILSSLSLTVFPFILIDLLKCFLSSYLALKINDMNNNH